jgi:hypothetical protein
MIVILFLALVIDLWLFLFEVLLAFFLLVKLMISIEFSLVLVVSLELRQELIIKVVVALWTHETISGFYLFFFIFLFNVNFL